MSDPPAAADAPGYAAVPPRPAFAARPSRPRARRAVRVIVYVLMLAFACLAVWLIDHGAMEIAPKPSFVDR
jgi:hypothetical protein